jgi:uncharacterized membrane protein
MKKKKSKQNYLYKIRAEYLFVILATIFGLFLVFINPPWQSNDEDRHFKHAYFISQGFLIPDQGDNKIGGVIPVNAVDLTQKFQGIRFSEEVKISKKKLEELKNVPLNPHKKRFFHDHLYYTEPVGYLPAAFGIFIGQYFNSNPVWLNWFGRIGNLAFYILIIFFAIKYTPVFKNVFLLYALTPMVLYQGASVTYDVLSIAFTFLIFALVLKYSLDPDSYITYKEIILFVFIFLVHRYSKDGYPLIPFLFFMIPPSKFKLKTNTWISFSLMFIFCVMLYWLPDWTWSKIIAAQGYHLEESKTLQKDLLMNMSKNIDFQLTQPGKAISNIIGNINHFRQEWTGGTIARFGYSYTLLPNWFFFLHGLILITVAFLESKKEITIHFYQKTIVFLVGFGSILGIILMSYAISPVGANMIFGLQGRYLVNAIPIILFLVFSGKIEFNKWKQKSSITLAIYIIVTLTYTLIYLNNTFYSTP